ncbi:hypothetical protein ACFQEP_14835 [Lactococcus lactis subsp. hordniae]
MQVCKLRLIWNKNDFEAARIAERDKQQELAKKEQELKHREQVLEKRETGDTQALSQQLEEERIKNKALENQNANIANTGESKIEGIIEELKRLK